MRYIHAGTFVRFADPCSLTAQGERIVIDGLDEVTSSTRGDAIDQVLKQLSGMGNPSFVLSCREADWRGASDHIKIQEDYGCEPVVLHLLPFDYGDAKNFLSQKFADLPASQLLAHFTERGLEWIYKNPLTLRLVGKIARSESSLPITRAGLLRSACSVMLTENNRHHSNAPHTNVAGDELLLAVGAICATQLLCGYVGIYAGPVQQTPEGYFNIADITPLPWGDSIQHGLRTRLFEADGERRFVPVHRVLAEYLGAKWLAACFDQGLSMGRIFTLMRHGDGVPSSLRELHAWVAHFSGALASQCIAVDPLAVLRYGDAEELSVNQARELLLALKEHSEYDPLFLSRDWNRLPASGLIQLKLRDEILSIISAPQEHPHLSMLLTEAMIGSPLVTEFEQTLSNIVFDPMRAYAERSDATAALHGAQIQVDWQKAISDLLELADADSARLAYEILTRLDAREIPQALCVDTVLSYLGLTETTCTVNSVLLPHINQDLFAALDATRLEDLIDCLVDSARPFLTQADPWRRRCLADLVRLRSLQIVEINPALDVKRFWHWINAFDRNNDYISDACVSLGRAIRENRAFHESLLEYVLLTPCSTDIYAAAWSLNDVGLELYPTPGDVCTLLGILRKRAVDAPIDPEQWRQALRIVCSADGIPETVRATAVEVADDDPKLLAILDELSKNRVPKWQKSQQRRADKSHTKHQALIQSHRGLHEQHAAEVAAGETCVLKEPAAVYLGLRSDFCDSDAPHKRVLEFLGPELGARALDGFVAVLERQDLPSAGQIAETHCQNRIHCDEPLLTCAIAETLRRGDSLSEVNRDTLAAAYMAWERSPVRHSLQQIFDDKRIGIPIEHVLFRSGKEIERHFRASIEPQLAVQPGQVIDFCRFMSEIRWRDLAANLAVEWLKGFPMMHMQVRRQLAMFALSVKPSGTSDQSLLAKLETISKDMGDTLFPHLARFFLQFDTYNAVLQAVAEEHPEFLWCIRDLSASPGSDLLSRLSFPQYAFIVNVLGIKWPDLERPTGVTSGDTNAWDASRFIHNVIFAIASRPDPEATEVLKRLTSGPAYTYHNVAREALAQQRQVRLDREYASPTIADLRSVMTQGPPESIDDMRVYIVDLLNDIQSRIRGSSTDTWETFWAGDAPHNENYCRNRLIDLMSGRLPESILFEPENHMPGQTRADIVAIRGTIGLPVEIKGQWHKDVWDAATEQLDAKYTRDWRAKGRGLYVVLWFGPVPGKQLRSHPDGKDRPETPEDLVTMLKDRVPEEKKSFIDVYVLDVSKLN